MADTPFSVLYEPMRALLGDRQVMGVWKYSEDSLSSALRTTLITGGGPSGYSLTGGSGIYTANKISPELQIGDDAALLLYDAVLLLVAGEDGALSWTTRSLSVRDGGDRKKDLLWELGMKVYAIRGGECVFESMQTLGQFLTAVLPGQRFFQGAAGQMEITVTAPVGLTIPPLDLSIP